MKVPLDARFLEERARFRLRLYCEECALFDPEREACAHGYPTEEHRSAQHRRPPYPPVVFCKDWDLA